MRLYLAIFLALCAALFFTATKNAQSSVPDLILFNGKIFTSDAQQLYVEAVAICGDRIVAVGESSKIKSSAGPSTKLIDLGGRTVIPGINDAHLHLGIQPSNTVELHLSGLNPSWDEVKSALAAVATKAPKGAFLSAEVGPAVFFNLDVNRESLDEISPDHPVMLTTLTGHAEILNSAALAKLGLRDGQPDPMGGRYEKDANGRLTGVLREYAVFDTDRVFETMSTDADGVGELREQLQQAAKFGITSIQNMSGAPPARFVSLLEKVPAPIRVRVMRISPTTPAGRDIKDGLGLPRNPSPMITVSGTKWLLDGVPLENTFLPRNPEPGVGPKSLEDGVFRLGLSLPKPEIAAILRETLESKDQLLVHVSGTPSATAMLDAMEASGGKKVWSGKRVRFEHGDGVLAEMLPRMKKLGIIDVQNPTHLGMISVMPELFHGKPLEKTQPLKSFLDAGMPLALGSDGPLNPYLNIMLASLHPNRPSEAITREQAVIAYTLTSAYAEFAEKEKGSLEPGKLADLAVLSQDIFTIPPPEMPKTTSVLTLVGGKIAFNAKEVPVN
jgi:predicted amidohydrolase YtcJ